METTDFRIYLQKELTDRCRRNPRYSLRNFAKNLNTSPSTLSSLLRGRRRVTNATIRKFSGPLGLSAQEMHQFIENNNVRPNEQTRFSLQDMDVFECIANWYYYAIQELIRTKDFKSDPAWIAKRLEITVSEVNFALERLQRLGLIEVSESGEYVNKAPVHETHITRDETTLAKKSYQKELRKKALDAIDEVELELRDHTSLTFAVNTEALLVLKDEIKDLRQKINNLAEKSKSFNEVYQLTVSLFPLTRREK